MSWLRTQTTGLYNTWKSTQDNKNMKLFLGAKWFVTLPDGDQLCLLVNEPTQCSQEEIVIVIHGLAGAATDPSVVNVAEKFLQMGHRVVRMNLRGSGHGAGYAKNIYHAGRDEDILAVVNAVSEKYPDQRVSIVSMSLSSNMLFRYLAQNPSNPITRAVALSPVIDLKNSSKQLSHAYMGMINKTVLSMLKSYFTKRKRAFADTIVPDWSKIRRLYHFDEQIVVQNFSYSSLDEYYTEASALRFIPNIKTPWRAVITLDDPIAVSEKKIFRLNYLDKTCVYKDGGHLYMKKHGGLGEVAYKSFSKIKI